jgi:acyl-CoA thioester hydrolase
MGLISGARKVKRADNFLASIPLAWAFATSNTRRVHGSIFHYIHRVTYAECTVGNHIYYSRYLDLLEPARGELFRFTGPSLAEWQAKGVIFPVCECRLSYKHPARYDDTLDITLWLTMLKGVRLNFAYLILNAAGQPLVEAETLHACAGLDEKPRRLPADLLPCLQPYLRSPVQVS